MTAQDMQRRNLLRWAGTGAVATAAGVVGGGGAGPAAPPAPPAARTRPTADPSRVGP